MRIQEFAVFRDIQHIQPQRIHIELPAFTLPESTWRGASVILAEYPFVNSYYFSVKVPFKKFGKNFGLAVRYVDSTDPDNTFVVRYKFWSFDTLFYPIYNGDVIGPNAVFEIWSLNTTGAPTNPSAKDFDSSVLVFQINNCCSCCTNPDITQMLNVQPPTIINPYAYCNPLCLPIST